MIIHFTTRGSSEDGRGPACNDPKSLSYIRRKVVLKKSLLYSARYLRSQSARTNWSFDNSLSQASFCTASAMMTSIWQPFT
mmetsp:Transcript_6171/g.11041  ORF Transcript_6171/g.11041 Transcript_6171/m.11041 type:complete len:81 (+) Transcript_6171:124-366(+)